MGINISVYSRGQDSWPVVQDWFDSTRFQGDSEFDYAMVERNTYPEDDESAEFWRPNMDLAEQWIRSNIVEDNQRRLLEAIDRMRADAALWFYSSY